MPPTVRSADGVETPADPSSLRALLEDVVDYAGLFPPAGLPHDEAIRRYARHRRSTEAWMLARFVVPAARLEELDAYVELFADDPPFRLSVLGPRGTDESAFRAEFDAALTAASAFRGRHGDRVRIEALEVALPDALLEDDAAARGAFLPDVLARTAEALSGELTVFFEVPIDERASRLVPGVVDHLAAASGAGVRCGLKLRTGGLEPAAFPPAAGVALAIDACRQAGVPFKATAGLHHPVRRYDESVGTAMYGFLNVFGAAVLAAAHQLDPETIANVLMDDDPGHFTFSPDAFAWRELRASTLTIRRARERLAVSFGSCSFDEPREDLRSLGLI